MRTRTVMSLVVLLLVAVLSTDAPAQKVEIGPFGGGSFWTKPSFTTSQPDVEPFTSRVEYKFVDGGVFGVRARENITDHFGFEQSWMITGTNNAVFADGTVIGTRVHQLYFNLNLIALSPESKVRPYFSGGGGWSYYRPTDAGQATLNSSSVFGAMAGTGNSTVGGFNVGAGLKMRMAEHLALDISARDFVMRSPTYNFPHGSDRDMDNNLQLQLGLHFTFGGGGPLIVHNFMVAPAIQASNTAICPGESAMLRIDASDSIPENKVTYQWTADGQQVSTEPQYTYVAPGTAGPHNVGVRVFYMEGNLDKKSRKAVAKNPGAPTDRTFQVNVKEYKAPTATASMDRTILQRGDRLHFTSAAQGSECSGALLYRWSANDGRIAAAADQTSADFDGSNLVFNDAVQGQQCKPVKVTLEVTDQKGGMAADSKDIQVCYTAPPPPPPVVAAPPPPPPPPPQPKALQLSDINFGKNSARVNNCAKRVLANDLYPQLTDAAYRDFDVYLVGHRDTDEQEKLTKQSTSTLDRDRVLNAASFLSGAGASCKDIELTRVNVAWTATEQKNDFHSNLCDASTVERGKDAVSSADPKAKNRRVEVWLVPKGASLPAEVVAVEESRADIAKRGCPK